MLRGYTSVHDTWSSREPLFKIGTAVESMPKGAFEDLHRCLHFTDDWDWDGNKDEWQQTYQD